MIRIKQISILQGSIFVPLGAWVIALSIFLVFVQFTSAKAQDWEKIELQSMELAQGMWAIYGAGGNHVLATGPDGVLLVDADYSEMGEKLLAKIQELAGQGPQRVIDTHWHFDHVGGNQALREAGAELIAHQNVRSRMITGQHLDVIDHDQPPADPGALPVLTFTDTMTLYFGQETITLFHVPFAHTDGDVVVHFHQANVIHTGDIVFYCGYPFIDLNAGGGIDGIIAAVKSILALCDENTQIVPGHGPVADKVGLEKYLNILEEFRAAVAAAKAKGMSLEEILASDVTDSVDQEWGDKMFPPEAFKEMVYRSLQD
ncbi:MAG: MBL fold metallo-hydrolase [Gemmatimonadales bacterium]|nr:MBL fold metallo-hydrolase [Gemmatimonadales bacterium]